MGRGEQSEALIADVRRGAAELPAVSTAARRHPERNEDSFVLDPEAGVAAVFDGMGGAAGGDLISSAAAGALREQLSFVPPRDDLRARLEWLRDAVALAAREAAAARPSLSSGTTGIVACFAEDHLLFAGAGDSRAYLLRDGELRQLSRDDDAWPDDEKHDRARELCDQALSASELKDVARFMFATRNRIGRDLCMLAGERPRVDGIELAPGDIVILTSDGVHDNLARDEIAAIAREHADDTRALVRALNTAARERADDEDHLRAKDDDITALALRYEAL